MEKFLLVNYHFGVDDTGFYQLTEMRDYVQKMIEDYEKFCGALKPHETPASAAPGDFRRLRVALCNIHYLLPDRYFINSG